MDHKSCINNSNWNGAACHAHFKMAATQQVFEIAQLFEVSDPNTIESHSVESKRVSTLTGSYKETEFCELPGGSRASKSRAWSARNPPALMTVHRYTLDVKFVCERLRVKSLACTCIRCCSIAVPLPESSGPRIEHCCFQESPHYNVLALYMSNSECACVSCVSQCMCVALIPHDPLPPAH